MKARWTTLKKLSERQKKLAEYYYQSGNLVESALKVGYSKTYAKSRACELLKNVSFCKYLEELTEKSKNDRILTATQRQEILSDIARNEENFPNDRIKSIDVLNKMTGEYLQKVEITKEEEIPKLLNALKEKPPTV